MQIISEEVTKITFDLDLGGHKLEMFNLTSKSGILSSNISLCQNEILCQYLFRRSASGTTVTTLSFSGHWSCVQSTGNPIILILELKQDKRSL